MNILFDTCLDVYIHTMYIEPTCNSLKYDGQMKQTPPALNLNHTTILYKKGITSITNIQIDSLHTNKVYKIYKVCTHTKLTFYDVARAIFYVYICTHNVYTHTHFPTLKILTHTMLDQKAVV